MAKSWLLCENLTFVILENVMNAKSSHLFSQTLPQKQTQSQLHRITGSTFNIDTLQNDIDSAVATEQLSDISWPGCLQ